MSAELALTILYVADLQSSAAFYDAAFGFPKSVDVPEYVEYQVNAGACLGLMPQANTRHLLGPEMGSRTPTDGCPRGEVYLLVDDPDAAVQRLTAAGARCTSPLAARDWGDRAAYFLDPDGYVIAVAQRMQASS
ncbi:MAG: VOC family protein [Planctomycetes bacterium]|nr:VOC family protein [Planctomycetota bacterium]